MLRVSVHFSGVLLLLLLLFLLICSSLCILHIIPLLPLCTEIFSSYLITCVFTSCKVAFVECKFLIFNTVRFITLLFRGKCVWGLI